MASSAICNWWERDRVNRRNNTGRSACYGSICLKHPAFNYESTSIVQCEAINVGLQMMLVELAPLWKLGLGGMPLAPLVQILVIFRTTGNAGSSQNQVRKKVSGKLSRTRPLTLQYKGRNTLGGNRIKGVFRGICQPKGDQLGQGHIAKLAEFALAQPQACYTAYTFGLKHRWTYFLRTLPDIQDLLESLENAISYMLIPAITERK